VRHDIADISGTCSAITAMRTLVPKRDLIVLAIWTPIAFGLFICIQTAIELVDDQLIKGAMVIGGSVIGLLGAIATVSAVNRLLRKSSATLQELYLLRMLEMSQSLDVAKNQESEIKPDERILLRFERVSDEIIGSMVRTLQQKPEKSFQAGEDPLNEIRQRYSMSRTLRDPALRNRLGDFGRIATEQAEWIYNMRPPTCPT
jgi:hypothetical protein